MNKAIKVDIAAWEEGRVPPDVVEVMCFVYLHRRNTGSGPAWSEIIEHMNWEHLPRSAWRGRFKRMRRWGLRWELNQANSTSIAKGALPFVRNKVLQHLVVL